MPRKAFFASWVEKAERGGPAYNALDLMKLFAIFNMTVDHLGAYFFPDLLWFRAIGRITFPVWFFLVGYSRSREIGRDIWIYALLLILIHPFVGQPVFAVNALVTVICCRYVLNLCTDRGWIPGRLPELAAAFFFLSIVTMLLFEYGSVAFMFALMGRMVKTGEKKNLVPFAAFSYLTFMGWQAITYDFNMAQFAYVVAGTAAVVAWLAYCPLTVIWPDWRQSPFKRFIAVLSRNTLPYYFYHRFIFQVLAAVIVGKGLGFSLKLFSTKQDGA